MRRVSKDLWWGCLTHFRMLYEMRGGRWSSAVEGRAKVIWLWVCGYVNGRGWEIVCKMCWRGCGTPVRVSERKESWLERYLFGTSPDERSWTCNEAMNGSAGQHLYDSGYYCIWTRSVYSPFCIVAPAFDREWFLLMTRLCSGSSDTAFQTSKS